MSITIRNARLYFIGGELGRININYADETSEEFPLVLGDNLWWGQRFFNYPEPFASNKEKLKILENSLFLLPAKPVQGGFRVGVIEPKNKIITSIEFSDRKEKLGTPVINAMTVLVENDIKNGKLFSNVKLEKERRLDNIRNAMYTTEKNFPKSVPVSKPKNYRGPDVKFGGGVYGEILENIFYHNLADMNEKAEKESGMFRESTKDAANWIEWQFENPEISGATNDVLQTDSEANFSIFTGIGYGYTIYADYPCMEGLLGFAEMAESIGKNKEAEKWRARAKKMKKGMEKNYIEKIENKPPMWTRHHAGWSYLTSHLAPLIFLADRRGFKPEDDDPEWREITRVTYKL